MKIYDIITERRSNPELNISRQGPKAAVSFLKQIPQNELKYYGVSMTEIPKLGINPQTEYNTPIGVYFYPANYYISLKGDDDEYELPFQDSAPYIQILKIGGKILFLSEYSDADYDNDLNTLFNNLGKLANIISADESSVKKTIVEANKFSEGYSPNQRIWYLTGQLARLSKKFAITWNSIFRFLGYSVVIDDQGQSIIHYGESYQGVVLDPKSMSLIKTIINDKESKKSGNHILDALNKRVDDPEKYMKYIMYKIPYIEAKDIEQYKNEFKSLGLKVASILDRYPQLYQKISSDGFSKLQRLADKNKMLLDKFTAGYKTKQKS